MLLTARRRRSYLADPYLIRVLIKTGHDVNHTVPTSKTPRQLHRARSDADLSNTSTVAGLSYVSQAPTPPQSRRTSSQTDRQPPHTNTLDRIAVPDRPLHGVVHVEGKPMTDHPRKTPSASPFPRPPLLRVFQRNTTYSPPRSSSRGRHFSISFHFREKQAGR